MILEEKKRIVGAKTLSRKQGKGSSVQVEFGHNDDPL